MSNWLLLFSSPSTSIRIRLCSARVDAEGSLVSSNTRDIIYRERYIDIYIIYKLGNINAVLCNAVCLHIH